MATAAWRKRRPAVRFGTGSEGDSIGHLIEPGAQQCRSLKELAFLTSTRKVAWKASLTSAGLASSAGSAQDQRPVPRQERREGGLIAAVDEPL